LALKANDLNWFRPVWRRYAVTGFIAAWCVYEWFFTKDPFWGVLVGAALAYSIYNFFFAFPKEPPKNESIESPRETSGDDGQSS
jgi:hypothetical protein